MDIETSRMLSEAMTRLRAQDMLRSFEANMFAHVKDQARKDLFRKQSRVAYPQNKKQVSTKDMAQQLQSMLMGR